MFVFSPALAAVPLDLDSILELHISVNQPAIAAEGLDAQEACAYFISGRGPEGVAAYIYMHMLTSKKALIYEWDAPIDKSEYPEIHAAAVQFIESMGFMMDDLAFRRMPPEERERVAGSMPIFKPLVETAAPQAEPSQGDVVELAAGSQGPESIFELPVSEPPSTQAGYEANAAPEPAPESAESPLEDKTFKVFLRLLTSV